MKHALPLLTLATAILLNACTSDPTQSDQYKQLQADRQELAASGGMKDSTINEMFGAFNRVTENLRAIREKQGLLANRERGVESGATMEQTIVADLRTIDSLLTANKRIVAQLRRDAKDSGRKLSELEKAVIALEASLGEKDVEISALKEQLTSTNASLASMIEMYQDQEQLSRSQQVELNKAFYTVGTQKELRENGVLTKEGGFIGLGKVSKLNTEGMNTEYFRQVDVSSTVTIPVGAKKAKLVTSHPEGSYELVTADGQVKELRIQNPAAFWSVSKYLVVQADR